MAESALPRRRGRNVLALLALLALLAAGAFAALKYNYDAAGPADHTVRVQVRAGDTLHGVFSRLSALGALAYPRAVELYLRLRDEQPRMEIGVYDIPAYSSPAQIVRMFEQGRVVLDHITVIDGVTFADFLAELDADPDVRATLRGKSDAQIMAALGHPGENPEGRFFPDTYSFAPGTTDLTLLRVAYRKMAAELRRIWAHRSADLPVHSPYQALILASIIEKETGLAGERARIAGVFVNRLRRGMPLQSDPTVIYALGKRYHGTLSAADMRVKSPYNTYLHTGLPPTPICLPSKAALHAAVHPAKTRDLYFVATGKGGHVFSRTLARHDAQVLSYIRQLRLDRLEARRKAQLENRHRARRAAAGHT
ncbi:MAG: endolytic transglycosylase MltG [Steroidobacteraceae bacterium]